MEAGVNSTIRYMGGIVGVAILGLVLDPDGSHSSVLAQHCALLTVFVAVLRSDRAIHVQRTGSGCVVTRIDSQSRGWGIRLRQPKRGTYISCTSRRERWMSGRRVARSGSRRGRKGVLVAVVAAGLLALALGWSVNTILANVGGLPSEGDDSPSSGTGGEPSPTSEATDNPQGITVIGRELLSKCAAGLSNAEKAFSAAKAGVRDWSDHTQARTDLLRGRISEKKMNAVWTRTQNAGPADQEQFQEALQTSDGTSSCDDLEDVPESQDDAVTDCVARAESASDAVSAAEAVMGDWDTHLHHMTRYADGGMTSGQAQRLWVRAWRSASINISAYREGQDLLASAPTCNKSVP